VALAVNVTLLVEMVVLAVELEAAAAARVSPAALKRLVKGMREELISSLGLLTLELVVVELVARVGPLVRADPVALEVWATHPQYLEHQLSMLRVAVVAVAFLQPYRVVKAVQTILVVLVETLIILALVVQVRLVQLLVLRRVELEIVRIPQQVAMTEL
jgi:hypothetical protein